MGAQKTCFVVMGFGKKTDLATGRVLDLDKSYKNIIKPAVTAAGLTCVRADEIVHSGTIDVPMFQQLLTADVVVADLSTANLNAYYELGVRHALRPYTTIIIGEEKMMFPFDTNHLLVRTYKHLGEGIDYDEVMRMQGELKKAVEIISSKPADDSPVYAFLTGLQPPRMPAAGAVGGAEEAGDDDTSPSISILLEQAEAAMKKSDFATAKALFSVVRGTRKDAYFTQKLALATYKSRLPTPLEALNEARRILVELDPDRATDPETLGLWGAIHKRIWELTEDRSQLDTAIRSYEKGFYLKRDYYNGINVAYLFNVRASLSRGPEAVADFVLAQRARREVIPICDELTASADAKLESRWSDESSQELFWVLATLAEAWFGLGDQAKSDELLARLEKLEPRPPDWMVASAREQLAKLAPLLAKSPTQ